MQKGGRRIHERDEHKCSSLFGINRFPYRFSVKSTVNYRKSCVLFIDCIDCHTIYIQYMKCQERDQIFQKYLFLRCFVQNAFHTTQTHAPECSVPVLFILTTENMMSIHLVSSSCRFHWFEFNHRKMKKQKSQCCMNSHAHISLHVEM